MVMRRTGKDLKALIRDAFLSINEVVVFQKCFFTVLRQDGIIWRDILQRLASSYRERKILSANAPKFVQNIFRLLFEML